MNVAKSFPSGVHAVNWGEGRVIDDGELSAPLALGTLKTASPENASAVVPFTLFSRKKRRVRGTE